MHLRAETTSTATALAPETTPQRLAATVAMAGGERREAASLAVAETAMRAGEMTPLHAHEEDEALQVIEGAVTVYAGGQIVRVEAGSRIVLPKGVVHTHRAEPGGARYVSATFASSAARYQDFARAVALPASGEKSWPSADEVAALSAIARPNGIAVEGPPGVLPAAG